MHTFPECLKTWRSARRYSQLDLAMEAEVSARHISFLETGRAKPSREMIAKLGDALDLPLDARNQMLTQAGFAARFPKRQWEDQEMAPIRAAIDHMLTSHLPYPAVALDRLWKVLRLNRSAAQMFAMFGIGEGDSLLDLVRSDQMPELVENWPEVAAHTTNRLRTESAAQGGVSELDEAAAQLAKSAKGATFSPAPVVPTIIKLGDQRLSLFGTLAQFGTPEDVLLDDLKIELYFPADETSKALLQQFAEG